MPLGLGPPGAPEAYEALGTGLPAGQGLTGYYANLHRDWCWGDAENAQTLRMVETALGPESPGAVLLLGTGAGRLAFDLHRSRRSRSAPT
jgi:hypothetical protein